MGGGNVTERVLPFPQLRHVDFPGLWARGEILVDQVPKVTLDVKPFSLEKRGRAENEKSRASQARITGLIDV